MKYRFAAPVLLTLPFVACVGGDDPGGPGNGNGDPAWSSGQPMAVPLAGAGSAVYRGQIYVIGGMTAGFIAQRTVQRYNPATDTWTQLNDLPDRRAFIAAAAVNDTLYAIGGISAVGVNVDIMEQQLWAYMADSDTWVERTPIPITLSQSGAVAVGGEIILVTGLNNDRGLLRLVDSAVIYNPTTDSWRRGNPSPHARRGAMVATLGGLVYSMGGFDEFFVSPFVDIYDPATDTWTTGTNIPSARSHAMVGVMNGRIHVIGGQNPGSAVLFSVHSAYDPATDSWELLPELPVGRFAVAGAALNGRIYSIGGFILPSAVVPDVDIYTPQ